jgi:hypothetical protein
VLRLQGRRIKRITESLQAELFAFEPASEGKKVGEASGARRIVREHVGECSPRGTARVDHRQSTGPIATQAAEVS